MPFSQLNERFETVACALCGSENRRKVFDVADINYGIPGTFQIVRCMQCGLVFQNPRIKKEFLSFVYPENYEPHTRVKDVRRDKLEDHIKHQSSRYRIVKQVQRYPGTLLDVGSGMGDFLNHAQKRGWNVYGIEIDADAYKYQKKLGLKVYNRELTEVGLNDSHFDVVTLWDAFEHIANPVETLNEIHRILKTGGAVVMSLPNFNSFERRLFGPLWFALDPPRHLYHYTPKTISQVLKKAGFEVERITFATAATILIRSARFLLKRDKSIPLFPPGITQKPQLRGKQSDGFSIKKTTKRIIFFSFLTPFLQLLDRLHIGGHIIVIARKNGHYMHGQGIIMSDYYEDEYEE